MKKTVKRILNLFHYDIVKIKPPKKEIGFNSEYLSSVCAPNLIIDVGVGHGTFTLYHTFPQASILLIEPLVDEFQESLDFIQANYSCELIGKALGSSEKRAQINFDSNRPTKASLFDRTNVSKNNGALETKTISVTTLDSVLENRDLSNKSVLLKIDAEGGELAILEGAKHSLQFINTIIAEVSIAKRFEDSYNFIELVSFLASYGFEVYSFLKLTTVNEEPRQRFADILFQKADKKGIISDNFIKE